MDIEGYKAHNEANRAIAKKLGASLNAANARIAELEARLAEADKQCAALKVQLTEEYRDWMKDQCNEECRFGVEAGLQRAKQAEARMELWRKSEEGTLAQMAETNERFEGALSTMRALEARVEALRVALEQVEWVSMAGCDHAMTECPWCGGFDWSGGHEDDCARQAALSPEQPAEIPNPSLAERLDAIAMELNHYAYGKDETGERYPEWEEISIAFAALERAVQGLQPAESEGE